ncbi:MAG: 23S rRNA (guanosine(2251)-2'-O)-methyltransferase RlmB, partial [Muribaculaceae bacterium]|nr:23S rRNA (guanosine(2251)-2'-O)-methyltransferase RlmB [Muribaculaceae bacterium]
MEKSDYIFGIRAVIEAIEAGRDIDCVLIKKDLAGDLAAELMALIKQYGIVTRRVPIERINRITRKNHQGVVAMLSAVTYNSLENIVPMLYEEGRLPFMVLLDGLTDVRNFGAIARTCECAGVDAIVIPERDSVSVNADAVKTSAGALLHIPVCRERSILGAVK